MLHRQRAVVALKPSPRRIRNTNDKHLSYSQTKQTSLERQSFETTVPSFKRYTANDNDYVKGQMTSKKRCREEIMQRTMWLKRVSAGNDKSTGKPPQTQSKETKTANKKVCNIKGTGYRSRPHHRDNASPSTSYTRYKPTEKNTQCNR